VTQTKLNRIETQLNNNNNRIFQLQQEFNNRIAGLSLDFQKKFNELLNQDKWITDVSYEFLDITEDKLHINVKTSFSIKELDPNCKLYLIAINDDDDDDWKKIEINLNGYLSFLKTIPLDLDKDYTLYLLSESTNENKQEKLTEIKVKDRFSHRIVKSEPIVVNNSYHFTIRVDNYDIPNFKIETVKIRIINEIDESIVTIDYTDQVSFTENDHYQTITGNYPLDGLEIIEMSVILVDYFGNTMTTAHLFIKN